MKKQPSLFATDKNGRLLVRLAAVMSPLVAMADGLSIVLFEGEDTLWLDIDVALGWCKLEIEHSTDPLLPKMIAVMERVKKQEQNTA